jgi:hypothetical protein
LLEPLFQYCKSGHCLLLQIFALSSFIFSFCVQPCIPPSSFTLSFSSPDFLNKVNYLFFVDHSHKRELLKQDESCTRKHRCYHCCSNSGTQFSRIPCTVTEVKFLLDEILHYHKSCPGKKLCWSWGRNMGVRGVLKFKCDTCSFTMEGFYPRRPTT